MNNLQSLDDLKIGETTRISPVSVSHGAVYVKRITQDVYWLKVTGEPNGHFNNLENIRIDCTCLLDRGYLPYISGTMIKPPQMESI